MKLNKITLSLSIMVSCLAFADTPSETTPNANDQEQPIDKFYLDKERGWFWYEQLPQILQAEEQKKQEDKAPTVIPKVKVMPTDEAKEKPLTQAWFRENFAAYRDRAIENPNDEEAMRAYLYLEKYMRDRATKFAYQRQKAVYADPFLDSTTRRSTANFGMKSMNIEARKNKDSILSKLGKNTGIFFFYRSDCSYCKKQMPLIKQMENNFGFTIKPVSLDGQPLPNSPWDGFLTNKGQAESLGVLKVPAMYLFDSSKNTVEMIAQGLQSAPQLEKRIIHAALRSDLITEQEVESMKASGLYQDANGVTGGLQLPNNIPDEFKHLYLQSIQQN